MPDRRIDHGWLFAGSYPSPGAGMKENLAFIDSLRGWAAFGVILVHCTIFTHQTGWAFIAGTCGQRGVQLFYCLSAFTLCYTSYRRQEGVGPYFLRRFFRIAPLFYCAILGNILLNPAPPSVSEVLTGMLFIDGFTPNVGRAALGGWSISAEAIFYVLLPLILLRVHNLRTALLLPFLGIIIALPFSTLAFNALRHPEWSEYFYFLWFPIEFPIFCLGITAFFLYQRYGFPQRHARQISAGLVLLALVIFIAALPVANRRLYVASFAFVPLILGLSLHPWKALVNPVSGFLGKISYSIYLVHPFWLIAAARLQFPTTGTLDALLTTLGFVLGGTSAVSLLTHRWIEQPGIALGRAIIQKRRSAALPETLAASSS